MTKFFQPNFPFAPAKLPVFYGWIILVASVLGTLTSIPGQTIGVSVFTDHLIKATGLSRLQLANAYLFGTVTSGCLLPFGGKLLDQLGARRVAVLAAIGLGLTLVYLTVCDRLSLFFSAFLPFTSTTTAAVLLVIGFVSLRFCGQGMLTMTSRTMLGKWFDRRRGQVSGGQGIFVAFGFAIAPYFFSQSIALLGWRGTWLSLAAIVGIGMSSLGWLLFRDNPEICGLRMDGEPISPSSSLSPSVEPSKSSETLKSLETLETSETSKTLTGPYLASKPTEAAVLWGLTRQQALKTLAFWAVTLAFMSQALSITGITFNIVSIGAEMGIAEADMVQIFVPIAVVSTAVGYGVGVACDRVRIQSLFIFMMLFQAAGIAAIANLDIAWMIVPAVVGLGVSGGCFGTLTTVVLPRFFGRAHLGAIAGVQMMAIVIASALGPSLLANSKSITGSYTSGLYVCCLFAPVVIFSMLVVKTPTENRRV
ncbi:MFS transporter [cf. Phormidesmis sp. LEGE 11477]|uniref:MFS transporter n=1 Tax=cf. Phormidesmis sp. LEGE 11477 TaxID=1828680 RepID=UPI0018802237|nr:MFS transporter [cf. Phormidesmis sp. LEGE 11477]MBE9063734.1 MFS transporter [cf. Phormidesmis sp. LEGE 11477]